MEAVAVVVGASQSAGVTPGVVRDRESEVPPNFLKYGAPNQKDTMLDTVRICGIWINDSKFVAMVRHVIIIMQL